MIGSAQQLEKDLYDSRPDLWAIYKAMQHARTYRAGIWTLLTVADQEELKGFSERLNEDA